MTCTRVKICGVTRPEDAALVAESGADAIGLNFFAGPRRITPRIGASILTELGPFPMVVGLIGPETRFMSDDHLGWESALYESLHYFQVYDPSRCRSLDGCLSTLFVKHVWPVFHVAQRSSLREVRAFLKREYGGGTGGGGGGIGSLNSVAAVVLDTASKAGPGGTGQSFDWRWVAEAREAGELAKGLPPLVLAGGLTPQNVAEAIRLAQPYAVDVSSGVEVAGKPGVKDPVKVRDFMQAVRGVGCTP